MINVFLFGTMDQSVLPMGSAHWRTPFMSLPNAQCFNPFVANWTADDAQHEAEAMETTDAIVVNITRHTRSIGTLAELGWLYNQCVERNIPMFLRVEKYQADEIADATVKDCNNARKLALAHATVAAKTNPNLYICTTEAELLECVKWFSVGALGAN